MEGKRNNGAIIGGSILIVFGLLSLLGQFNFWGSIWPLIIVGLGGLFFVGMLLGGKSYAGLAIPGTIISGTGVVLLIQNLTGYWQSWSYGWTMMIVLVGLGIFIMGLYRGDAHSRRSGLRVMEVGIILLVIFGSFFEMLFSIGNNGLGRLIFPVALMLLGGYLVLARSGLLRKRHQDSLVPPGSPEAQK
jgi:hypothetical protein